MEASKRQTMTEIKMENCLLMQANTELEGTIADLKAALAGAGSRLAAFEELDVAELTRVRDEYAAMEAKLAETLEILQRAEGQRGELKTQNNQKE